MGLDNFEYDIGIKKSEVKAVQVSPMEKLYEDTKDLVETEKDILSKPESDITELVFDEIEYCVKNEMLLNWQLNGKTTGGKSITAITLRDYCLDMIEKYKNKVFTNEDKLKYIVSDQTELIRFYEDNPEWVCVEVDEDNTLSETGLNATVESQLDIQYSNIFAQRFVNKIRCSPTETQDINAYLILEIMGKDVESKTNRVKVYYRDIQTGLKKLLGYADIYVGDTLNKDYYLKYRDKKFLRMDLLQKEGIRDVRELEFAIITVECILDLKRVATKKSVPLSIISLKVKEIVRANKKVYSIITLKEIEATIKGILDVYSEYKKYDEKIGKLGMTPNQADQIRYATENIAEYKAIYDRAFEEEKKKIRIFERYKAIEV